MIGLVLFHKRCLFNSLLEDFLKYSRLLKQMFGCAYLESMSGIFNLSREHMHLSSLTSASTSSLQNNLLGLLPSRKASTEVQTTSQNS